MYDDSYYNDDNKKYSDNNNNYDKYNDNKIVPLRTKGAVFKKRNHDDTPSIWALYPNIKTYSIKTPHFMSCKRIDGWVFD